MSNVLLLSGTSMPPPASALFGDNKRCRPEADVFPGYSYRKPRLSQKKIDVIDRISTVVSINMRTNNRILQQARDLSAQKYADEPSMPLTTCVRNRCTWRLYAIQGEVLTEREFGLIAKKHGSQ